jgi:hypothetical protein
VSFFSPRIGFVCDNIVRYEVSNNLILTPRFFTHEPPQIVLPSGTLINATQTSYPDLWLALRGGSNNFGIVTAFESTAFKQGKFW